MNDMTFVEIIEKLVGFAAAKQTVAFALQAYGPITIFGVN
jgi:hypothetical protein